MPLNIFCFLILIFIFQVEDDFFQLKGSEIKTFEKNWKMLETNIYEYSVKKLKSPQARAVIKKATTAKNELGILKRILV